MSRQLSLILLCVAAAAIAGDVSFEDCGSSYTLLNVDIEGCNNTDAPCAMNLGQRLNVTIEFHSGFRSESLTPDVHFILVGVDKRADVTPKNCQALLSSTCPIDAGQNIVYSAKLTVEEDLVPTRGDLKWVLKSETNITLVCMRTAVHLFPPPEPY